MRRRRRRRRRRTKPGRAIVGSGGIPAVRKEQQIYERVQHSIRKVRFFGTNGSTAR